MLAGRSNKSTTLISYNQNDELVCEGDSWVFRTDRDEARERGTKYTEARGRVEQYTQAELDEFTRLYQAEEQFAARSPVIGKTSTSATNCRA